MPPQIYEEYWQLTNAFTDYNGEKFLNTLKTCIDFIDEYKHIPYSAEKYSELQNRVCNIAHINDVSVRKSINQLVKMGFIHPFLTGYAEDSVEYINATTNKKRQSLLSKIVYTNSSFDSAVNNISNLHQINFLIKTLTENGKLTKNEIIALMLVDIASIEKGFLELAELKEYEKQAIEIGFRDRKYNQIGHLLNLLGKLEDITFRGDTLYFEEDAKRIFGDEPITARRVRDPYLHRLYKNQLQEEVLLHTNDTKCMLEDLAYPVLIASHIKPFITCTDQEAYDANNGLLLSKNLDSLFDLGYITFDDSGALILSTKLPSDVAGYISKFSLRSVFINRIRMGYMDYHRTHVFKG